MLTIGGWVAVCPLLLSSFRAERGGDPEPSGARERGAVADTVAEQIAFGASPGPGFARPKDDDGFQPSPE